MKITVNSLTIYGAPQELISYFEKTYPNGEEVEKIFADSNLDLLHFIVKYFDLSKETKQLYEDKCEIETSSNVYNSKKVSRSKYIVGSSNIDCCGMVHDSENVSASTYIYNSTNVSSSSDVWESRNVQSSSKIMLSSEVLSSSDVLSSQNIYGSEVINNCSFIEGAKAIYKSNNLTNSYFCGFCNNLNNSIFCLNLNDKNYQIFNKDVDPNTFEVVREELLAKLVDEDFKFITVNPAGYYPEDRYKTSIRFDYMFENLSSDFYGWVGSLPNYSEELFLSLFFKRF